MTTHAALYMVTILGGAIGEWNYYVLGSAVEVVLLAMVIRHARHWTETRHPTDAPMAVGSHAA
ncbi:hypothetical protein BH24ACT5_BH24ACT5_13640 [soil metagenome]